MGQVTLAHYASLLRPTSYGVHHIDIPVTPERVWRAIQEARKQAAE